MSWQLYFLIGVGVIAIIFWAANMSTASYVWQFIRDRSPWWSLAVLLFVLALILMHLVGFPIVPLPR